jgi:hypothetical protein
MDNKKWYYEFEIEKENKKEDGSSEKEVRKFAILKPNRRLREDGELFFASETSRFAKAGVLPKAAWNTILANGGGTISENDREHYGKLLIDFRDKSYDIQALLIKSDGNRTDEDKKRLTDLTASLDEIRNEIQSFESSQVNIFENTAESKARNRAILWWVTNLAFQQIDGNFVPFFTASTFEEKLDQYDEIEQSENSFSLDVLRRITYLITLWFLGRAETTEDFVQLDKDIVNKDK